MPAESLKVRMSGFPPGQEFTDQRIVNQALLDGIQAAIATLCAKLDADAGVTDTNYATLVNAALNAVIVD